MIDHPLGTGNFMALLQSRGRVKLFKVSLNNLSSYGINYSPNSLWISPELLSGNIDLFLLAAATLFLMILISKGNGSPEVSNCICWMLHSPLNTAE
jgi:hypothetical protein